MFQLTVGQSGAVSKHKTNEGIERKRENIERERNGWKLISIVWRSEFSCVGSKIAITLSSEPNIIQSKMRTNNWESIKKKKGKMQCQRPFTTIFTLIHIARKQDPSHSIATDHSHTKKKRKTEQKIFIHKIIC